MKIRFALIVSLAILLMSAIANAGSCPTTYWYAVPDGRISPQLSIDSTTDLGAVFRGTAGHSYSFEVESQYGSVYAYFGSNSNCPTANDPSWNVTTSFDPYLYGGARASMVAPFSNVYYVRAYTYGSNNIQFAVTDTTMYSPRWSTWSGFYTSYGLTNTTNGSVTVSLKFVTTSGSTAATYNGTIAAGQNVFVDTRNLTMAANQAGQAILTHTGPPGAILADGFIQHPVTGAIQPVKFETVRATH